MGVIELTGRVACQTMCHRLRIRQFRSCGLRLPASFRAVPEPPETRLLITLKPLCVLYI